ncbi:MAG: hypothetical protein FWF81_12045 [Defluviitaleaceae bacterium]|nr:hypothetical protein [Defluviitaleaceae bacterium]
MNTPVVFFTLGTCREFQPILMDALEYYIDGAGYVQVPEDFNDAYVKSEIGRVWQEFLNSASKADILRANFFIKADETAFALPNLIVSAEKYFTALYPAGILIDVYCLPDDANLLENAECRKDVFNMLREIQGEGLCVYLLSNLTSVNIFVPNEYTAQTAALLTLFKNFSPTLHVTEADASRYNEFFFLENCATRNGCFLTAGSVILSVPQNALKSLIMAEILSYGERDLDKTEPKPLKPPNFPPKIPEKTMDYLYNIAIPDYSQSDKLTRNQWISRLFGQRLEQIINDYDREFCAATEEGIFPDGLNFYELLRHTSEGGFFDKMISDEIDHTTDEMNLAEEKCNIWLGKMPIFAKHSPESATRRLSPLKNQDLFPYIIASGYIKRRFEIQNISEKISVLEQRKRLIAKFNKKLKRHLTEVKTVTNDCYEKSAELDEVFAAFTERKNQNASDFFRKKFAEYAVANKSEIKDLSEEMTNSLRNGEFLEYKKRLDDFIEKNILPEEHFTQPIMEILQELSGGEALSAALGEWVYRCIHLGIRLKTGYTKLHTEANLFMPKSNAAFEVKKSYETRGLGRMNLFAKENTNRVAVMYHAGAFGLDELYYSAPHESEEVLENE